MTASVRFRWFQATQNARRRHPKPSIDGMQKLYRNKLFFVLRDMIKFFWCRIKDLIDVWLPMLPLLPPALSPQIFNESLSIFNVFRWFSIIISYSKWVLKESQSFWISIIFNDFQRFSIIFNVNQWSLLIFNDLQWSSMIFNDYQLFSKIFNAIHWFPMMNNSQTFNGSIDFSYNSNDVQLFSINSIDFIDFQWFRMGLHEFESFGMNFNDFFWCSLIFNQLQLCSTAF